MFELSPVNQFNQDITQPLNKGAALVTACTYYSISLCLYVITIPLDLDWTSFATLNLV